MPLTNKGISKIEVLIIVAIIVFPILMVILLNTNNYADDVPSNIIDSERVYECDYHTISFKTHISFEMDGEEYHITGNLIRFFTDPLKLTKNGKDVGYASDSYHIINQDDHAIIVDGNFEVCINGNFELLGESYELYDKDGNKVGYAEFNAVHTGGAIYDANGHAVAVFSSPICFNDYTVKIYDNNICSDKAMLMVIASYVSDYKADEQSSRSSKD